MRWRCFIFWQILIVLKTIKTETTTKANYNDDDYLNSLSDKEYVDFVANFLRPTYIELLFVVVFFALMLVGIIGNILVVYVVTRNKSMVKINLGF